MAHVEMAGDQLINNPNATGVLDSIEHKALAIEQTSRVEYTQVADEALKFIGMEEEARRMEAGTEAESRSAASSNVHANLYGNIALEMSGIGAVGRAAADIHELVTDSDPGKGVKGAKTFEDDIKGANRKPGAYKAKPAKHSATAKLFGSAESNEETFSEKFGRVSSAVTGQGDCNTKSWGIKKPDVPSTRMQQDLILGKKISSELALTSVARARALQGPGMGGKGQTASLGRMASNAPELDMTLANGPKFKMYQDEESASGGI